MNPKNLVRNAVYCIPIDATEYINLGLVITGEISTTTPELKGALRKTREPVRMLIDTGATTSHICPGLANLLNLEFVSSKTIHGLGGSVENAAHYQCELSLFLQTRKGEEVQPTVCEIVSEIPQLSDLPYEVILGRTFLKDFNISISLPKKRLELKFVQWT